MAKRSFSVTGFTFTATSDSTAMANDSYMSLEGATSTQRLDVLEVYWGGLATTSAVCLLQLSRSQAGSTTSGLISPASDGPLDTATATLTSPPWSATRFTTGPSSSLALTDAKLKLAGNTFGGIVRWNAAPTQQWTITGNGNGNRTLFHATNQSSGANAVCSAHIIYEPY